MAYCGLKVAGTCCRLGNWGPGLGWESGSVVEKELIWQSSIVLILVCRSMVIGKFEGLEEGK